MVNIEIDGINIQAKEGAMVIEAADDAGIYIPRFCYHKKLSIAANCRMCLVEIEKVGKPSPACATPVTDGMKILTRSAKVMEAQKGVMEFLLINHPLDCPICDQGGECELQDIAVGYGADISKYSEGKRVVLNKDLGPLISTDMTRCIHCTRCVRFGEEIAGIRELGATGRGEHTEIGTFIKKSLNSELSGNIIDLCPVGALNSKPFRFSARAWEMIKHDTIAPHDCIGSNLSLHVRGNKVMRVVPRDNEAVNETWISDRDRFSYQALGVDERLLLPMIKTNGEWQSTDWPTALKHTASALKDVLERKGPEQVGALASAISTTEELYLLQKLMRSVGVNNIDHRLRQIDCSRQDSAPLFPWLGQSIPELEKNDAVLLVGSNIRCDQPLAAHRLRKACAKGMVISCINSVDYDFYFPIANKLIVNPAKITANLVAVARALLDATGQAAPDGFDTLSVNVTNGKSHGAIAGQLHSAGTSSILLGPQAINHGEYSTINALAGLIAKLSGSRMGYLSEAGNSSGAWLAGMVPHRLPGGKPSQKTGLNATRMVAKSLQAYVLLNTEPEFDSASPQRAQASLGKANFVVSLTMYTSAAMQKYSDVMLPIASFAETSGSYVNADGQWQSFSAAVAAPGEVRPAWKVLRVLANLLESDGFDYISSEEVRDELKQAITTLEPNNQIDWVCPQDLVAKDGIIRITETQMYSGDSIQRRAHALQQTEDASKAEIRINQDLAKHLGLSSGDQAIAKQNGSEAVLPVVIDNRIADNATLIYAGLAESSVLSGSLDAITITKLKQ